MVESDNLRYTRIALNNGSGAIPALGFGTLIPDPMATRTATKAALEAGFRQLDASERYRNEKEVGEAIQEVLKAGKIKREELFIATKLWNNNHRPERVKPAFEARVNKTPAQVLLAWAVQRGTALLTTSKTPGRIKENFEVSTLPEDAMREISEGIKSRIRFNAVVETGVPGFIPRGKGG
jgi:diketogulonate reductase-like aldo/keto reductase